MRDLARAALQLACETTIYACQRILDQLHATRPAIDDPLPDGYTGRMESDGPMAADRMPHTTSTLAVDTRREHTWVGRGGFAYVADPDSHGWIGTHRDTPDLIRIPPEVATEPYGPFYRSDIFGAISEPDWLDRR